MSFDPSKDSIIGWITLNKLLTENGSEFDLKSHPFWYDVLTDWNPNIVMLKAAQGGGTTLFLIKALYAMSRYGMNAAYTMPTASDVQDLASGKLNPIIRNNPKIAELVQDKDSTEQKRIGDNTLYLKGTWTDRAALSFSSDLNIHDEEDRSKLPVVEQYASRQQHSRFKWNWRFSNPSVPGHGVHKYWLMSDMKHWFIKCNHCDKEQYLSWPDSIDQTTEQYICKSCSGVLSEDARRKGRWVPVKTPKKPEYSGYWFNLMMAPWVSASDILKLHRTKSPEYFYNFVLGLPYAGSGNKLNEVEFFANLNPHLDRYDDPIIIGVDSGLPNWYVVGNKSGIFFWGKCDGWEEIHALMKRWPKAIAVCDQGGDLYGQRQLQETFKGRVYLCWFRQDRKTMRLIDWGEGKESGKVIADRNRVIQQVIDEFRTQRMPIYGEREDWQEPWTHFANMYKHVETDEETGQQKFEWKRSGPDHLALCTVYYRIGIERFSSEATVFKSGTRLQDMGVVMAPESNMMGGMRLPPVGPEPKDWRQA